MNMLNLFTHPITDGCSDYFEIFTIIAKPKMKGSCWNFCLLLIIILVWIHNRIYLIKGYLGP